MSNATPVLNNFNNSTFTEDGSPILLDDGGGELLAHEVFTIEPGLYGRTDGGVRIEDMLVVENGPARNLNRLHEGLDWRT